MVINKHPLFILPPVTVWEDPYFYFDLRRKIWRVRLSYFIIDCPLSLAGDLVSCGNRSDCTATHSV